MTVEERVMSAGFEDVILLSDYSYDDALIGVTTDNRAVYAFDKMVDWLVVEHGFTLDEAIEWIGYNTIRALPYAGNKGPIVIYRV